MIEIPFLGLIFFIYGTILGSFYNVVIGRLPMALLEAEEELDLEEEEVIPEGVFQRFIFGIKYVFEDIVWSILYLGLHFWKDLKLGFKNISVPPSHCPKCKQSIRFYDNIPILSWIFLAAKCRNCKLPISVRYPLNEFVCGLLFFYSYWKFGFSLESLFILSFLSLLLIIFWIDIDHQLILNVITYPGIFLGVIYNLSLGKAYFALTGVIIGLLLMEGIALFSLYLLGQVGMGGGDIRLAMMLGAWLGGAKLIVSLFLAFFIGAIIGALLLVIRKKSEHFPFGPAMVIGALISFEWGQKIWDWYFSLLYF